MKTIREYFRDYGMDITEKMSDQLYRYFEMLVEKNKVMNLTGITEYEDVVIKHFIDSAMIDRLNPDLSGKKIIDVGTGAGFPGLVLAILYPDAEFILVDSLLKRINFLKDVTKALELKNVLCFHARGEDFAKEHPEEYDLGVSRAVARMSKLAGFVLPLIKPGGEFIAYKGQYEEDEEKEGNRILKKFGAKVVKIDRFFLTEQDNRRSLVVVRKGKK